jgi:hypothetical protein
VEAALERYQDLHREEEARKEGANSRLTTVLGMSSIVSAITFGFVSIAFEKHWASELGWIGAAATLLFVFAVSQLVISVWHAVRGLQARFFSEASGPDVLREPNEQQREYLLRCVRDYAGIVRNHDRNNSDKTRRLDLAHRAILNFLGSVLLLVGVLVVAGWTRRVQEPTAVLAEQLRADPRLVEILRGPKGDRGDAGSAGAVGPPGPRGDTVVCPPPPRVR